MSIEALEDIIPNRCTDLDRDSLIKEVTEEEIRVVLFAMSNNKSPGPDGYNVEFYKAAWFIIGKEFIIAVKSFLRKGFCPKG